jgi:hypothetical protein
VLGYAHLAQAAPLGDFQVGQDVVDRHRTVAVRYDVQVVINHEDFLQYRAFSMAIL